MPRGSVTNINDIIEQAAASVVGHTVALIHRTIERAVAARVRAELASTQTSNRSQTGRRSRSVEMTRWVADRRARRVPKFVIEATGLDTKKAIVAKYGENAAFKKGKPLPPVLEKSVADRQAQVRAKPPIVRKKPKAAA